MWDAPRSVYYRPQRSFGKVMFLHVSVILSTGQADTPPGRQTAPLAGRHPLPGRQTPPTGRHSLQADTPRQADTPPLDGHCSGLECILVIKFKLDNYPNHDYNSSHKTEISATIVPWNGFHLM